MFHRNSLITRIAIGKSIGFFLGAIGAVFLYSMMPDIKRRLLIGFLFWYTTIGAFIGVMGVFTWHPVLKLPIPWWLRSSLIGGWMNFVLVLFAYDEMEKIFISLLGQQSAFHSPWWLIVEGIIVGLFICYVATKIGGEGKSIIEDPL